MLMQIPLIRMRVTIAIMHCRAANGETNKFVFYEHQDIMQIFLPPVGEEQHRMGVIIHTIGVRDTSSCYKNVFLWLFYISFLKLQPDPKNRNAFFSHENSSRGSISSCCKYNKQVTIPRHLRLMRQHHLDGALAPPDASKAPLSIFTFIAVGRETKPNLHTFLHWWEQHGAKPLRACKTEGDRIRRFSIKADKLQ